MPSISRTAVYQRTDEPCPVEIYRKRESLSLSPKLNPVGIILFTPTQFQPLSSEFLLIFVTQFPHIMSMQSQVLKLMKYSFLQSVWLDRY